MFLISITVGAVVNDGGLSWLRKSYQRMKEQAEREQRSLGDVVAERYGVSTRCTLLHLHHYISFCTTLVYAQDLGSYL